MEHSNTDTLRVARDFRISYFAYSLQKHIRGHSETVPYGYKAAYEKILLCFLLPERPLEEDIPQVAEIASSDQYGISILHDDPVSGDRAY